MPPTGMYQTADKSLLHIMLDDSVSRWACRREKLYLRDTNFLSHILMGVKLAEHVDDMRTILQFSNHTWI